jgi:hypothetical protein
MLQSRRTRQAGHVALTGERINAFRTLMGVPEEKRPLEMRITLQCISEKGD